jgi:hypothetical protein
VQSAVDWLKANGCEVNDRYLELFSDVKVKQSIPDEKQLERLPKPVTYYAKYAFRGMCASANERTFIGALAPRGSMAINAIRLAIFQTTKQLLYFSAFASSIVADFIIKLKGRSNVVEDDISQLPILEGQAMKHAVNRLLRLSCLSSAFADIWKEGFNDSMSNERFVIENPPGFRFESHWKDLSAEWSNNVFFRNDYHRRQAMLEIDVLVAIEINLTIEELIQVYSVQFPVMKTYENFDEYDLHGRRLPNTTRKDAGAKELRDSLANHDGKTPVTVSWEIDNRNQTVTKTFHPPFKHIDRIEDYKVAYRVFKERLG